jgi:hypothetical protein
MDRKEREEKTWEDSLPESAERLEELERRRRAGRVSRQLEAEILGIPTPTERTTAAREAEERRLFEAAASDSRRQGDAARNERRLLADAIDRRIRQAAGRAVDVKKKGKAAAAAAAGEPQGESYTGGPLTEHQAQVKTFALAAAGFPPSEQARAASLSTEQLRILADRRDQGYDARVSETADIASAGRLTPGRIVNSAQADRIAARALAAVERKHAVTVGTWGGEDIGTPGIEAAARARADEARLSPVPKASKPKPAAKPAEPAKLVRGANRKHQRKESSDDEEESDNPDRASPRKGALATTSASARKPPAKRRKKPSPEEDEEEDSQRGAAADTGTRTSPRQGAAAAEPYGFNLARIARLPRDARAAAALGAVGREGQAERQALIAEGATHDSEAEAAARSQAFRPDDAATSAPRGTSEALRARLGTWQRDGEVPAGAVWDLRAWRVQGWSLGDAEVLFSGLTICFSLLWLSSTRAWQRLAAGYPSETVHQAARTAALEAVRAATAARIAVFRFAEAILAGEAAGASEATRTAGQQARSGYVEALKAYLTALETLEQVHIQPRYEHWRRATEGSVEEFRATTVVIAQARRHPASRRQTGFAEWRARASGLGSSASSQAAAARK